MTDEQKACVAAAVAIAFEYLKDGGRLDGQSDIEAAIFNERLEKFIEMTMPGQILDASIVEE